MINGSFGLLLKIVPNENYIILYNNCINIIENVINTLNEYTFYIMNNDS